MHLTVGQTLTDRNGRAYVYIGARTTSVGTREHVFCHLRDGDGSYWPNCMWTYKASHPATIAAAFPELAEAGQLELPLTPSA